MQSAMKLKVENTTIKASMAALGYARRPHAVEPQDRMGHALNMFKKSDLVNRYMQMYKAGELYALDKRN